MKLPVSFLGPGPVGLTWAGGDTRTIAFAFFLGGKNHSNGYIMLFIVFRLCTVHTFEIEKKDFIVSQKKCIPGTSYLVRPGQAK